jgi:transcriptional regulator with XRE-family HTH domain
MGIKETAFYRQVGQLVQARRRALKLTQEVLAQRSNVRRATIASIEAGRQSVPLHVLYQLARALETSVNELVPPRNNMQASTLTTVEIDGRLLSVPLRTAEFVRRMREGDGDGDTS